MNKLANWLASIVREKALGATQGLSGKKFEYRLIFRGPPLRFSSKSTRSSLVMGEFKLCLE